MQVDWLVGKNHLFKHSIILIKAWCYYESRILGAHHGLISTYALETLILYIFHLFHCSLNGPLAVRFRGLNSVDCACASSIEILPCACSISMSANCSVLCIHEPLNVHAFSVGSLQISGLLQHV